MTLVPRRAALPFAALLALTALPLAAQPGSVAVNDPQAEDNRPRGLVSREELIADRLRRLGVDNPDPAPRGPTSRADSLEWERHRRAASAATGKRIVVSIFDRRLWLIEGRDTILSTPVGVGMGMVRKRTRTYDFSTPRGRRTVLAKETEPIWTPPDWHYYGLARRVRQWPAGGVTLSDGRRVVRRGENLGIVGGDGSFEVLPQEHPLTWDGILYIPPFGTINRRIPEVLGKYKLDTGEGILIHGTNDPLAIGFPATHGCMRVDDEPLEFLYQRVEPGTPVYIY